MQIILFMNWKKKKKKINLRFGEETTVCNESKRKRLLAIMVLWLMAGDFTRVYVTVNCKKNLQNCKWECHSSTFLNTTVSKSSKLPGQKLQHSSGLSWACHSWYLPAPAASAAATSYVETWKLIGKPLLQSSYHLATWMYPLTFQWLTLIHRPRTSCENKLSRRKKQITSPDRQRWEVLGTKQHKENTAHSFLSRHRSEHSLF